MTIVLILLFVLAPVVPLNLYFAGNWYSLFHSYSIAMVFGIFSYIYFVNSLILSARIPFLDKLIGNDRVLRIHAFLAQAALFFAILHVTFKMVYSFSINVAVLTGIISLAVLVIIISLTVLYMNPGIFSRFRMINNVIEFTKKRLLIDYSKVKLIHNGTVAAILLITIHVTWASSTAESDLRGAVMGVWAIIAIAFWLYHKVIRPFRNFLSGWRVVSVKKVTGNIIQMEMQNRYGTFFRGAAGQFAYFRFVSKTCGLEEHPFTISSSPGNATVAITVKQSGDYTRCLENVQPGSKALIDGPYGIFVPSAGVPCLLIAGGIGITPFMPIVAAKKKNGETAPTFLVWTVRNKGELFCKSEFETLQSQSSWFTFVPIVTRRNNGQPSGDRIDNALLSTFVNKELLSDLHVYICGPGSLRLSMTSLLAEMGVHRNRIHSERFD